MAYPIDVPIRPRGESTTRKETAEEQAEAERLLQALFEVIKEYEGRSDKGYFEVEQNSTLYVDDVFLHPLKLETSAQMAIAASIDHLRTVRLLVEAGEMPFMALFTLMRSALETASVAIWLLESDSRDVRMLRLLQSEFGEIRDSSNMMTDFREEMDPSKADREARVERAGGRRASVGSDPDRKLSVTITSKIAVAQVVVAQTIPRERAPSVVSGIWRGFSGMTHGRGYAFQTFLDREELGYDETTGVVNMHFTTGARNLLGSLLVILDVVETALRLYGKRSSEYLKLPDDVADLANLQASTQKERDEQSARE